MSNKTFSALWDTLKKNWIDRDPWTIIGVGLAVAIAVAFIIMLTLLCVAYCCPKRLLTDVNYEESSQSELTRSITQRKKGRKELSDVGTLSNDPRSGIAPGSKKSSNVASANSQDTLHSMGFNMASRNSSLVSAVQPLPSRVKVAPGRSGRRKSYSKTATLPSIDSHTSTFRISTVKTIPSLDFGCSASGQKKNFEVKPRSQLPAKEGPSLAKAILSGGLVTGSNSSTKVVVVSKAEQISLRDTSATSAPPRPSSSKKKTTSKKKKTSPMQHQKQHNQTSPTTQNGNLPMTQPDSDSLKRRKEQQRKSKKKKIM